MTKKADQTKVELAPDAWRRFERAVDVVAKSPPQHRVKKKQSIAKRSKHKPPKAKPR